jgi:hypothetical protein
MPPAKKLIESTLDESGRSSRVRLMLESRGM